MNEMERLELLNKELERLHVSYKEEFNIWRRDEILKEISRINTIILNDKEKKETTK